MARQHKTPRQRAQEQLDVEERRVKKLAARRAHLQGDLNRAVAELEDATTRRDYLKKHPDLANTQPRTTATSTTTPTGDARA